MKHTVCALTLSAMFAVPAYGQELTIGSKMPDPEKRAIFFDNPIYQYPDCIMQMNRYTNSEGKQATYMAAFPSMNPEEGPFAIWDVQARKIYLDVKQKDNRLGPDGIIDGILDADKVNPMDNHPYCGR